MKEWGSGRGYALVLGSGDGALLCDLAKQTELKVVGLESDAGKVDRSRRTIEGAGLYGRVVVHEGKPGGTLPYTDYLFNVVVDASSRGRRSEVMRVLRPGGGVAVIGGRVVRRGPVKGGGEWTHMYGDAANTVCSDDTKVGGALRLQWFGRPGPRTMVDRHLRTVPPLWKDGRIFVPGSDRIIAADAYNGTILWETEVPDFRRLAAFRDCGSMAAADDALYVASGNKCLALDPATGKVRSTLPLPSEGEWGYLATVGKTLVGSIVTSGGSRRKQSREAISGTYYDAVPLVCSREVFAVDRTTGKVRWRYETGAGLILNPTMTVSDGRVYFVESADSRTLEAPKGRATLKELLGSGSALVAIDLKTGKVLWRQPHDFSALQHILYLAAAGGKLVASGSRNEGKGKAARVWYDVHVFDARTGRKKWSATRNKGTETGGSHGEQDHHPVIVGKRLYAEPNAFDLETGREITDWGWSREHRQGCGQISASASTFFFRHQSAHLFDLTKKVRKPVTMVSRPGCWINMIPAGGLLLVPEASSGCTCDFAVQTSVAFLPVKE